jgi:heme A synthase
MKLGPLLFRITGIVIFIQLLLGGLLTFNFIMATVHIITGFIVFIVAVATMIAVLVTKPVFRPLMGLSIGLVALIVIQIILGLETLRTSSAALAWIHFVVALGIYGMAIGGTFMSMRLNYAGSNLTTNHQRESNHGIPD